ncbi:MAG: protein translocase subunit SecF [Methanothrix sp.]|jgi:preprotein translocase subunit SecF|uniref:Protein-export membrane protein SecF n=1 Tax=Methanothrix harundinacea TaxID=301375 RepID=A0A101III2_9EURY|nr:MAG: Protein-export membrane protein SecF [Methanothrix harundinacea]KUK95763.1 MAG: Protein-export membrane protein SecF [Methanothrix harundinacea]MCP1392778.1 protein translocase subunit SecF [Methanothrix harundinacea]
MDPETFISKYEPRKMVAISLAVLAVALSILGFTYIKTGSPVNLGVEFTGGTIVTVPVVESEGEIAAKLAAYPVLDIRDVGHRYMIQMGPMDDAEYKRLSAMIDAEYQDPEIKYMGPVYSTRLQEQAKTYIPLSFLFMAVVVFLIFRTPFVSLMVILAAFSDIMITAAAMNVAGVKLSLGTVAALLMLIGYSVDSNILLNNRVLKRKGRTEDKVTGAFRTGIAMTSTTFSAIFALFLVSAFSYLISSSFTQINILFDISVVLLFGLLAGLMNTWVMNSNALRWYLARPKKAGVRRQRR